MGAVEIYSKAFETGATPVRILSSDRKIIAVDTSTVNRRDTLLSSVAYFDAGSKMRPSDMGARATIHQNGKLDNPVTAQNSRTRAEKPVQIAIHADMLKVSIPAISRGAKDRASMGGGIRGNVKGFSRASRKRMLEFMASVRDTGSMMFLTMTFDDSVLMDLDDNLHPMFEAFRRRFERAYPGWKALWRREWQDRKSGDFIGTFVPHYHFIIMTGIHYEKHEIEAVSVSFSDWGKQAWQEITGSTDENHLIYGFDVSPIKSRKHAYFYVSKYVGKQDNRYSSEGRCWGRIGKFNCTASETFYLAEEEYIIFRRLIKKWLKTRVSPLPDGATDKQIKAHSNRVKNTNKWSRRFARQSSCCGCTVFGLGDTMADGTPASIFAGYWQFIAESRRQLTELRAIERGYGN